MSPKQRRIVHSARSFLPKGGHRRRCYICNPFDSFALWRAVQADRTTFLAKPGKMGKVIGFAIRCCAARVLRNIKRNCCWMPRFQDTTITHSTIFHSFNKCWICKGSFPSFCLCLGSCRRAVCIIIFRCHPLYWLSERDAQIIAANARSRDRMKLAPFWEKLK